MHDAGLVCGAQALGDLPADVEQRSHRWFPLLAHPIAKVRTIDVLHRQVAAHAVVTQVVDACDVSVRDPACQPDLTTVAFEALWPGRADQLERDDLADDAVPDAVDRTHPACTEQLLDLVAIRDPRADGDVRTQLERRVVRLGLAGHDPRIQCLLP